MLIEKDTIKCEAVFNDDRSHRFLWKRVWNKDKPLVTVIMLNPCLSDNIITDTTTTLVTNNIARMERYGGVIVVNLYSLLTNKLNFRWNSDADLSEPENDSYILKAANESEAVILAWGKAADTNLRIADRAEQVLKLLEPCAEKMFLISDGERSGLHPLTPALRSAWQLEAFSLADWRTAQAAKATTGAASAVAKPTDSTAEKTAAAAEPNT